MPRFFTFLVLVTLAGLIPGQATHAAGDDLSTLAASLHPLILDNLPNPLHESSHNWGHTSMVANQVKWRGLRPRVYKAPRNDGTWTKLRILANQPQNTLVFKLGDLKSDGDRQTFKAFLAMVVTVQHERQIWESGVRLYSGEVRARVRIKANLDCENIIRLEKNPKSIIPDTIFRLRVSRADVGYEDLVVEHIAGIGGSGAKVLGETMHDALKQWRPSIERDLIAKANAAIVKVADTKEVRISLDKVFGKFVKGP